MNNQQTTIFDFIEDDRFCENDIINEIVDEIEKEFEKENRLSLTEKSYTIWEHVENLGYRLCMIYKINDVEYTNDPFDYVKKIDCVNLVKLAKEKAIDLSICQTPFFIHISTIEILKTSKRKEKKNEY